MARRRRALPLTIEVVNGQLVVRIGIDALMTAVSAGDDWIEGAEVLDADAFAAEIRDRLEFDEAEDGTTQIHLALDAAALSAVENGSEHVRLPGDDE